jgi:hypothetical protein
MSYKKSDLLIALLSMLNKEYIKDAGFPRACARVGEMVFINKIPENEYTELIRSALRDLNSNGCFNYE